MKNTAILSARAPLLIAIVVFIGTACASNAQENAAPNADIPTIQMTDASLWTAIDLLARQSGLNYIIDPSLSSDGAPLLNFRWTNITARTALDRVLKANNLDLVENPATTVARIAPRNLHVKAVDPSLVGGDTNASVPVVQMTDAPLDQAITLLATQAHLKIVSVEGQIKTLDGRPLPVVSFRWQNLTARQALVALLDAYDFTVTQDSATSVFHIKSKQHSDTAATMPLEQSNSGSSGRSSARRVVSISVIAAQLLTDAPILLVSLAALIVCLSRWQQVHRAAQFCLLGFALIASSPLVGAIAGAMIYNLIGGDHQRTGAAMRELSLARILVTSTGLVFLLIAVFTEREQRPVSPPPVPV